MNRKPSRESAAPSKLEAGIVRIVPERREVRIGEGTLALPDAPFQLLRVLVEDYPRVVTRTALMMALWGTASTDKIPVLEEQVAVLQRMLGDAVRIDVVMGIGYRLLS